VIFLYFKIDITITIKLMILSSQRKQHVASRLRKFFVWDEWFL